MSASNESIQPMFLRLSDVAAYLNLCTSTIYKLQSQDPAFPKSVKLTGKAIGWRRAEIEEWAENRPPAHVTPPTCS